MELAVNTTYAWPPLYVEEVAGDVVVTVLGGRMWEIVIVRVEGPDGTVDMTSGQ